MMSFKYELPKRIVKEIPHNARGPLAHIIDNSVASFPLHLC